MNQSNQNLTFQGKALAVRGSELSVGDEFPAFTLTGTDMADLDQSALQGKVAIISVVPSLDTPVCSVQTKRFNQEAASLGGAVRILTVSRDLPFAQARWCGAEGVESLVTASDYKYRSFGEATGTELLDLGILARALFVLDADGRIQHLEYVAELSEEPDYETALEKVRELSS